MDFNTVVIFILPTLSTGTQTAVTTISTMSPILISRGEVCLYLARVFSSFTVRRRLFDLLGLTACWVDEAMQIHDIVVCDVHKVGPCQSFKLAIWVDFGRKRDDLCVTCVHGRGEVPSVCVNAPMVLGRCRGPRLHLPIFEMLTKLQIDLLQGSNCLVELGQTESAEADRLPCILCDTASLAQVTACPSVP